MKKLIYVLFGLFAFSSMGQDLSMNDSLTQLLEITTTDEQKLDLLFKLAELNTYSNPEQSLAYGQNALSLASSLNNQEWILKARYHTGTAYWSKGELSAALETLQQGLSQIDSEVSEKIICQIYMRIGTIYAANTYYTQGLSYFNKALEFLTNEQDPFLKFALYSNIGKAYLDVHNYDSAATYLFKGQSLSSEIPPQFLANLLLNLADLYRQTDRDTLAYSYIDQCDSLAEKYEDLRTQVRSAVLKSEMAIGREDLEKAYNFISEGVRVAEITKARLLLAMAHKTKSQILFLQEDSIQALKSMYVSQVNFDSIYSVQAKNQLDIFNFTENEKEKNALKNAQLESELKASKQRMYLLVTFSILSLMLISFLLLFINWRSTKNKNEQLYEKNTIITKQNKQIEGISSFKTKIMGIMAHDVMSPINTVSEMLMLLESNFASPSKLSEVIPAIKEQVSHLNLLTNNVLDWAKSGFDNNVISPEKVNVYSAFRTSIAELEIHAKAKHLNLTIEAESDVEVIADKKMLQVIIRNLLFNAIKYSKQNGTITFRSTKQKDFTQLSITDTGVGMEEQQLQKLFSFETDSQRGTSNELGKGFGLIVCKDFVEMNKGTISVKSKPNSGTTFTIQLPSS